MCLHVVAPRWDIPSVKLGGLGNNLATSRVDPVNLKGFQTDRPLHRHR